jgi:hypothetical protein
MSHAFDPYYKWLGIPAEEQPPNHYRLLGIRLFEQDSDVIENAADGRMALVRNFHTGANAKQSQQLLNELAAARITLLQPEKREIYDEEIRRQQAALLAASVTVSSPAPIPQHTAEPPLHPIRIEPVLPRIHAQRTAASRPKQRFATFAMASLTVVLVGAAILFVALRRNREADTNPESAQTSRAASDRRPALPRMKTVDGVPDDSQLAAPIRSTTETNARDGKESAARTSERPPEAPDSLTLLVDPSVKRLPVTSGKNVLLVFRFENELKAAQAACERYGLEYEVSRKFEKDRSDYSQCHTLLCGSNDMDYWVRGEAARPEAFDHLEQFVGGGGHLIVLGSFNARGTKHLKRFGIETSFYHNDNFELAGRAAQLLIEGNAELVPEDGRMRSFGNFNVKVPHVVLLKNGQGHRAGDPKLATLEHLGGRVTFSLVEPNQTKGMWLIEVLLSWVSRGSPIPVDEMIATK